MTPIDDKILRDRARGALLGLAVGDALGTKLEFKPKGSYQPLTTMVGGGPFGLRPGECGRMTLPWRWRLPLPLPRGAAATSAT